MRWSSERGRPGWPPTLADDPGRRPWPTTLAARRHPATGGFEVPMDPAAEDAPAAVAAATDADQVILGTIDAFRHGASSRSRGRSCEAGRHVILMAMRMPTDADPIPEVGTALACWSIHDAPTEAAAAVLFGERKATGRAPLATTTGVTA